MNRNNTTVAPEPFLEEASLWVARLDRGLSRAEKLALDHFLRTAEARTAFLELAALSDRLNELGELAAAPITHSEVSRPKYRRLAMAASLFLVVALSLAYMGGAKHTAVLQIAQQQTLVYETSVGEQSIAKLPDGTQLSLNTDSRLRIAFSDSGRLAILDRGQAHFEVASDAYRPFSVRTGTHIVQVVGTRFSVYRTNDETTEVVVAEGTVRVASTQASGSPLAREVTQPPTLIVGGDRLGPGDIGVFRKGQESVTAVDEFTLDAKLAWREGKLVFRGETLEEALAEVGRYTPTRFEFLDEKAKGISVAGVFRPGDVNGLLQTLAVNLDIAYQRLDGNLILISIR